MVVVTNRIPIAKGHEIDFEDRFRRRVHLVDGHPGFVRNEVHRPARLTPVREAEAGFSEVRPRASLSGWMRSSTTSR